VGRPWDGGAGRRRYGDLRAARAGLWCGWKRSTARYRGGGAGQAIVEVRAVWLNA
jgi:hypothetical protein